MYRPPVNFIEWQWQLLTWLMSDVLVLKQILIFVTTKYLILVTWWTPGPIGRSGPGTIVAATTISCDQYKHRSPVTIFLVSEQLLKTIENFRKDRLWKAKYYAVISSSLYVLSIFSNHWSWPLTSTVEKSQLLWITTFQELEWNKWSI